MLSGSHRASSAFSDHPIAERSNGASDASTDTPFAAPTPDETRCLPIEHERAVNLTIPVSESAARIARLTPYLLGTQQRSECGARDGRRRYRTGCPLDGSEDDIRGALGGVVTTE
jgi:hypothetical protein